MKEKRWTEYDEEKLESLTSLLDIFQVCTNLKQGAANRYNTWLRSLKERLNTNNDD